MLNDFCSNHYQIYGLKIATTRSLPGLMSIDPARYGYSSSDVIVELLGVPQGQAILSPAFWKVTPSAEKQEGFYLWTTKGEDGTYWRLRAVDQDDILDFVLNPHGTRVWGFWSGEHLFQDAVSLLLGSVLGHLLRLRGSLCLHAGVVVMNEGAIAIVGESGAGKSTLTAALSTHGYAILSDDLAAISHNHGQFWVQPGYPYLRLWSDSLKALQVPMAGLTPVSSRFDKRFVAVATIPPQAPENRGGFAPQALPLKAVYILGQRDASLTEAIAQPLAPTKALQHLLTHAYGQDVLTKEQRYFELQQLAAIAQMIPVQQLLRPDDLKHLNQLCQLIINFSNS